ncbi:MAG: 50S ribosomal protein L30 [Clostridiales bacterium]|jgi:large subunit ribosomal protein L30|nr:50S ribosomal protein L30 [Clostridiales bacterium]
MEKTIKVTLIKSLIGSKPNTKRNAEALGLKKIGDCYVGPDTPATRGKVRIIEHLVELEEEV